MRRILHLAVHDTRLFILAKENFFFMFLMPVMFMLFFSTVLGGGGGPSDVKISLQVVNEDQGFMGDVFLEMLAGEQFDTTLLSADVADSTDYIRRLTIPADFTAKVLATEQVKLDFKKQSSSNIEYDAAADVRLHQAQVAFLGGLIRWEHTTGATISCWSRSAGLSDRIWLLVLSFGDTRSKEFAGDGNCFAICSPTTSSSVPSELVGTESCSERLGHVAEIGDDECRLFGAGSSVCS